MTTPMAVLWRAVVVAVLATGLFAAGWTVNGWRKDAEIAELTAARAQADLTSANTALNDLREAGGRIRQSADDYLVIKSELGGKLDALRKDLKNAKPLPAGCRPDDVRVRKLSDAVDATKQAAGAR